MFYGYARRLCGRVSCAMNFLMSLFRVTLILNGVACIDTKVGGRETYYFLIAGFRELSTVSDFRFI